MTDHQHTADVLNLAADLIQERGWRSGDGWNVTELPGAGLCLEGGIMAALGWSWPVEEVNWRLGELYACPAYGAVRTYLNERDGGNLGHIFIWNDRADRTAEEVVATLRAAAVIEQARADEHTAADTGYDTAAAMLAVADDAAARTLAALR